jgi:translation initiation factor 2B subunit (eIF-2B alpha/beta/delta family)
MAVPPRGRDADAPCWAALRSAAADRRSGSAVVAAAAGRAIADMARALPSDVIEGVRLIASEQPVMAACLRLGDVVLRAIDDGGPPKAADAAEGFALTLEEERIALVKHLAEQLPTEGTVVTVSASSLVIDALKSAPRLRVLCAVSEPGGEGRDAADTLKEAGMDCALIPDGALAQQSTRADVVVFGADAVGPVGILNKTGTLAAALGARTGLRPCLCVASTTKIVDESAWPYLVAGAERRLMDGVPVFEEVALSFVTKVVLETGPQSQRAIRRLARSAPLHPRLLAWLSA